MNFTKGLKYVFILFVCSLSFLLGRKSIKEGSHKQVLKIVKHSVELEKKLLELEGSFSILRQYLKAGMYFQKEKTKLAIATIEVRKLLVTAIGTYRLADVEWDRDQARKIKAGISDSETDTWKAKHKPMLMKEQHKQAVKNLEKKVKGN